MIIKQKLTILIGFILFSFSLLGAESIMLFQPDGGEILKGSNYYITWFASSGINNINIALYQGGIKKVDIANNINANDGYYEWDTTNLLSDYADGNMEIRIEDSDNTSTYVNSTSGFTLDNYTPMLLSPAKAVTEVFWGRDKSVRFFLSNADRLSPEDIKITLDGGTDYSALATDTSKIISYDISGSIVTLVVDTKIFTGNNASGNDDYKIKLEVLNHSDSVRGTITDNSAIKVRNIYFTDFSGLTSINTGSNDYLSGSKTLNWTGASGDYDNYIFEYKINSESYQRLTETSSTGVDTSILINTNQIGQTPETEDIGEHNVTIKIKAIKNGEDLSETEMGTFKVKHRPYVNESTISIADLTSGITGISQNATINWDANDPDNDEMKFKIEYKKSDGNYAVIPFFETGFIATGTTNANGTLTNLGSGHYSFEFDSNKYTSSNYSLRVTSQDTLSYISEGKEISTPFTVNHKPIITNINVNGIVNGGTISGNIGNKKDLKFTVQHSDDGTGDTKLSYLIEFYDKVAEKWRTFSEFRNNIDDYASLVKYLKLSESLNLSGNETIYTTGKILTYSFDPNEIQSVDTADVKFRVKVRYERDTELFEDMDDYTEGSDLFKINHKPEITSEITISDDVTLSNISGNATIKWQANDPDSDEMRFKVSYQKSGGSYIGFNFFDTFKEALGGTDLILNSSDYEFTFDTDELETGTYNIKVEAQEVEDGKVYTYDVYTISSEKTDIKIDHKPIILSGTMEVKNLSGTSITVISGNNTHQKRLEWNVRQADTLVDDTLIGYIVEYYDGSIWQIFSDFSDENDYKKAGEGNITKIGSGNYTDEAGIKMRYTFNPNEIQDSNNIANIKFRVKAKYFRNFNSIIYDEDGNYLNELDEIEESGTYKVKHKPTLVWDIKTKDNSGQSLKDGSTQVSGMDYWTDPNAYIDWTISDPDGDDLTITVTYENIIQGTDQIHKENYTLLTENENKTDNASWNTAILNDSRGYIVKVELKDNSKWSEELKITESTNEFLVDNANKPTIEITLIPEKEDLSLNYTAIFGYPDNDVVWGKSGIDIDKTGIINKEVNFDVTNNDLRDYLTIDYNIYFYNATNLSPTVLRTETGVIVSEAKVSGNTDLDISSVTDGEYYIKIEADNANEAKINVEDDKESAITEKITILNNSPYFKNLDGESKKVAVNKTGGLIEIEWGADDPNNNLDSFNIYYKKDGDTTWNTDNKIVTNLNKNYAEDGNNYKYVWGLLGKNLESDTYYDVRIVLSDGINKRYIDVDKSFIIRFKPLVKLLQPSDGDIIGGTSKISWSISDPNNAKIINVDIMSSNDNGINWDVLKSFNSSTGIDVSSFDFDTQTKGEGQYKIKVIATNEDEYDSTATVNTEKYNYSSDEYTSTIEIKHTTKVNITYPIQGQSINLSGNQSFSWIVSDPDKDEVSLDISYSIDGENWTSLVSIANATTTVYKEIDTKEIPESESVSIKYMISDGTSFSPEPIEITGLVSKHKPLLNLIEPIGSEIYKKNVYVRWLESDPDGDNIISSTVEYIDSSESGGGIIDINNGEAITNDILKSIILNESGQFKIKISIQTDAEEINEVERTITLDRSPEIYMMIPVKDQLIKDEMKINWRATNPNGDTTSINEDMKVEIYYSIDGGAIWSLLYKELTQTTDLKVENTDDKYEYVFDTRNGNAEEKIQSHIDKGFSGIPDSENVKLKVVVIDKTNVSFTSEAETDLFTIANYIPIINLVEPGKGVLWYGKRDVIWEATSNTGKIEDDKNLKIKIEYSKKSEDSESNEEESKNWKNITLRTFNDGIYTWNTEKVPDGEYYVKVEATNNSGTGSEEFENPVEINNGEIDLMADEFFNYPNPFKSSTTFKYILPNDMRSVRVDIYTSQGQKIDTVYDLPNLSGIYDYGWVASGYANGAYFARLVALGYDGEEYIKINKMAIIK